MAPRGGPTSGGWTRRLLSSLVSILPLLSHQVSAIPYTASLADYNINIAQDATNVLQYQSERQNATYTPSPTNWRSLPVYTILLDKFADGDPTNNDYFKTRFEHDWREQNFRFGGDLQGIINHLDYIQGMGMRTIYIAGTPFLNMPWQADSTSIPLLLWGQSLTSYGCHALS